MATTKVSKTQEYQEGVRAFLTAQQPGNNPYPPKTSEHTRWRLGWANARAGLAVIQPVKS